MSKNRIKTNGIDASLDKRLNETESCYNFEKLNYKSGLLDNTVDATYIIHLEGNGRYDNILKQLKIYTPTSNIFILLNKGYLKCSKKGITTSSADLTDCYLQIFKHAKTQNLNNILILEDDFMFNEKMKDSSHIKNVNDFLTKKNGDNFIYLLGAIPWFLVPYDSYNYRCLCSSGTHCIIYSKAHRDDFLLNYYRKMIFTDWDINYNVNFTSRFIYYTPLCYQLCCNTDNSKDLKFSNKYAAFASEVVKYFNYNIIYRILGLDTKPEPGYSIMYFYSKIIFYIMLLVIIYVPFLLLYVFKNFNEIKDYMLEVFYYVRNKTKKV
jgi:hypothetical protein